MNILPIIPQFFPEENGKNLVAVSDFDWTLSVWKNIPDRSGTALWSVRSERSICRESMRSRPVDTIGVTGKDSLVMPTFLAYDGNYLWVGEFKFSSRLLRFSGKL